MLTSLFSLALKTRKMIIIKYFEWLRFEPDYRSSVYELCDDEFKKIRNLKKEEAVELIKANHLEKVHGNKYGTIWK